MALLPEVPVAVAYSTVTSSIASELKFTVKVAVAASPSNSVTVVFAIVTIGSSSSVITKSAAVCDKVPLVALARVKVAVSVNSGSVSVVIGTSIVASVLPDVTVAVPVTPV